MNDERRNGEHQEMTRTFRRTRQIVIWREGRCAVAINEGTNTVSLVFRASGSKGGASSYRLSQKQAEALSHNLARAVRVSLALNEQE